MQMPDAGASAEHKRPGKAKIVETLSKHRRNIVETSMKLRRNLTPQSRKTKHIADAGDDARARDRQSQETTAHIKPLKGDSALGFASGEAVPPEPHSDADKAHVDAIVAEMRDTFRLPPSGLRNGVYDQAAYRQAITLHKRDQWLNNLATFVGEHIDALPEKMAAWEAIEQTRSAGSRDATPPDVRRAVDELSRLRETSTAYAEAAE